MFVQPDILWLVQQNLSEYSRFIKKSTNMLRHGTVTFELLIFGIFFLGQFEHGGGGGYNDSHHCSSDHCSVTIVHRCGWII